jgi:hypothetical protein
VSAAELFSMRVFPIPAERRDRVARCPRITLRAKPAEIGYKGNTGSVRLASAKRTLRKIRESIMRFLDERIGGVRVADRPAHPLREK